MDTFQSSWEYLFRRDLKVLKQLAARLHYQKTLKNRTQKKIPLTRTKVLGPSLEETLARPCYQWSASAPISVTHPKLIKEWHWQKNGVFTPDEYTFGSQEKVWWRCKRGPDHEWQAVICERTSGTGCPFCSGKQVSVLNSLRALYPEIAKEWHPTRNGKLTPDDITAMAKRDVWWQCSRNQRHIWRAKVPNRTAHKSGCPYCAGKVADKENNLKVAHPEIAKDWHPIKNGLLTPDEVRPKSNKRVWWQCRKDPEHEWETKVLDRVNYKTGCPFCSGKRVTKSTSLAVLCPEIAREWHPTKNGKLTPNDVTKCSVKRAWWQCSKYPIHEWNTHVSSRGASGSGCPFCYELRRSQQKHAKAESKRMK